MEDNNSQNMSQQNDAQTSSQTTPQSSSDFSKTTIVVLVILTLLISTLSTWVLLGEVSNVKISQKVPASSSGEVRINILPAEQPKTTTGATGQVVLKLNKLL